MLREKVVEKIQTHIFVQ